MPNAMWDPAVDPGTEGGHQQEKTVKYKVCQGSQQYCTKVSLSVLIIDNDYVRYYHQVKGTILRLFSKSKLLMFLAPNGAQHSRCSVNTGFFYLCSLPLSYLQSVFSSCLTQQQLGAFREDCSQSACAGEASILPFGGNDTVPILCIGDLLSSGLKIITKSCAGEKQNKNGEPGLFIS